MFIIFLHDFGMIRLELTRTDVVFSRTIMVLFLCRNKSSQNAMKINGEFFWKIKKILERRVTGGEAHGPHEGGGCAHVPHGLPVGPLTCSRRQPLL